MRSSKVLLGLGGLLGFGVGFAQAQTSATVEVIGTLPPGASYSYTCPTCRNPWSFCRCNQEAEVARPSGDAEGGFQGGGGGGFFDAASTLRHGTGTHHWELVLNPGGIPLAAYRGTTVAIWDYDDRTLYRPSVDFSATTQGLGVTVHGVIRCDGIGPGPRGRWTGTFEATQGGVGVSIKYKRGLGIYSISYGSFGVIWNAN